MSSRVRAALAAAALALLAAGCGAGIVPQIHTDSERVPTARRLYGQGDYAIAVDLLNEYSTKGAGNADIDQAVYLLGLAYMKQKEWSSAQTQFERILREYPESDSAAAAGYRLGEALFGQARGPDFDQEYTLKALAQWENFVKGSPADPFADAARQGIGQCRTRLARKLWRSGDLYVKLKLYEPARRYFRGVLDDYSDTVVYGDAIIGMAMTDARLGRKDSALVVLRGLEHEFAGKPLGLRAAQVRSKVEKWPAEGDRTRRAHRPVEAPMTPVPTSNPTPGTSYSP